MSEAQHKLAVRSYVGGARKPPASARFSIRGHLSPRLDAAIGILGVLTVVILWCVLSYGGFVREFALPTPTSIGKTFVRLYQSGQLITPMGRSLSRVARALFFVTIVGIPIGLLMGAFAPVDAFLRKLVSGGKALPITGLTFLVILWMGLEERGKVFYIFLGAIFYMILLVKNAICNVNEEYTKVALDLGGNRWQVIWRVLLPGALPQIWEAIAVCSGIMWTYIVLAEYMNNNPINRGLGGVLQDGLRLSQPPQVFCMLIAIAVISSLTDFMLHLIRKRFFSW